MVGQRVAARRSSVLSAAPVAVPFEKREPPDPQPDWAAMLGRAGAGDQAAMTELYDGTSAMVFGLALRILGNRDAAEDAVVEVYAQAWRQAKAYDARRGTAVAWLLTLTRSRAIDMLRIRQREGVADPLEAAGDLRSSDRDPEEASTDAQRQRFVRGALHKLSTEQREAIELAYFSGLSHNEIALKLGQPLGTVKTRIRLGMMHLRELLNHLVSPVLTETKERI